MRNKGLSKLKSAIYPLSTPVSVGTSPVPTTKFQSEKWCKIKKGWCTELCKNILARFWELLAEILHFWGGQRNILRVIL